MPFRLSFDEIVGANKCTEKRKETGKKIKKPIISSSFFLLTFSGLVYLYYTVNGVFC